MSWTLCTNAIGGRMYLRDYRRGEPLIWTPLATKAEKFSGAAAAIDMARRLSFILGERVEAVSTPQDAPGEVCTTLHCGRPVEPGRMHCEAHLKPWCLPRSVVDLIDPDLPIQGVEAAMHMAVQVMSENSDESLDDVDEELEKLLEDGPHHADCDHLGGDCRVLRQYEAEQARAFETPDIASTY